MNAQTLVPVAQAGLLRISTAGSVDDGKSTLIGRMLYETKSIFEDQLLAIEQASRDRGADYVDLALLTDGLRAEREQGITIDVAYRYFSTLRRSFILADTPGHVQYTRNMVTGASTADLAIILLDASRGVTEQSRRHLFIASLLRMRHLVVCINKMDLVGYSETVFEQLRNDFQGFARQLDVPAPVFIPISALHGDNIVGRAASMPWYHGPSLLVHLEGVDLAPDRKHSAMRFPVQWIIRPQTKEAGLYRGYAGQLAGGVLRPGDDVVVLPSGFRTRIKEIDTLDGPVQEAFEPMSVTVTLTDDVDVSRGDMICHPDSPATVGQDIAASVCWMSQRPMAPGRQYLIKHTTRKARGIVQALDYRIDINTLRREHEVEHLGLNDIGLVRIRTTNPLLHDSYNRNRATGSFIMVDEGTNETVGAGVIGGDV